MGIRSHSENESDVLLELGSGNYVFSHQSWDLLARATDFVPWQMADGAGAINKDGSEGAGLPGRRRLNRAIYSTRVSAGPQGRNTAADVAAVSMASDIVRFPASATVTSPAMAASISFVSIS